MPRLDIGRVPWSRQGSFMTLSTLVRQVDHPGRDGLVEPGLYLFDVSGTRLFGAWNGIFRLQGLAAGSPVEPVVVSATPARLELDCGGQQVEATWDGPDRLRLRGRGGGLRLTQSVTDPLGSAIAFPRSERAWHLIMGEHPHYVASCLAGTIEVEAPRVRTGPSTAPDVKVIDIRPDVDGRFELMLTQYETGYAEPRDIRPFDACVADTTAAYAGWLEMLPAAIDGAEDARALAAYLMWSCLVGPRGLLERPTMLMSKNWMFATWSWDHCFNAQGLALADGDGQLAWDQLMSVFDRQDPLGALPDIIHDHGVLYGWVKPPVHGWTVRTLDRAGLLTNGRLEEIYPRLERWTEWWLEYRDQDGDGLCEYHHGNDGMDNATVFDIGLPVTAPDLAALLILQMDVLADLARRRGDDGRSRAWRDRADAMLERLIERLWDGRRFIVPRVPDGHRTEDSRSVVPYLPMILGQRLPDTVRRTLVESFRDSGLVTPHGPATEAPDGPLYQADGYWRGPIWAPVTALVVDGLTACGEKALADELARGFVDTCRRSGFAENFEATTGRPLRDTGYTWSAATFLVLADRTRRGEDPFIARGRERAAAGLEP